MNKFKAYRVHTIDGKAICRFETPSLDDLDKGHAVIKTAYSAVTLMDYGDGLR